MCRIQEVDDDTHPGGDGRVGRCRSRDRLRGALGQERQFAREAIEELHTRAACLDRRTVRIPFGRDVDAGERPCPQRRRIELESCTGDTAPTIIDIAREKGIDAIVVGRRGVGQLAGLLLGSVSQKLASLAPLPVIVVP
jgi:nucleotide-binding universal stress UspA family protein